MTGDLTPSALEEELRALVEDGVLSPEQATGLWRAAQQDHPATAEPASELASSAQRPQTTGVLDVLGYVGGALLLGAVIFVGATLWDDFGRGQRIALALASFVVPLAGGLVLELSRSRRGLARALLALACVAAGFASQTIIEDQDLVISTAVAMVAAVVGGALVRSAAFYAPGWAAAMVFVRVFIAARLNLDEPAALAYATAGGFLLVGLLMVIAGLLLNRHVAWTLAGISVWVACLVLMADEHSYLAMGLATLTAAALLVAVVRSQRYAFAVVGCVLILSIWPWALYQVFDSAFGVAVGLVAAGCVLIAAAVVLTRRRRRAAPVAA